VSHCPMLTLAIPNRNGGRYLEHTLASLDRNRPWVRWWLQDSCSTDNSVEIATRFAGPGDHIEIESDKSQPDGLNRAISRMGGDIIGFINSDDCLADGAAEAVLKTFAENPDVDLVYGEVEWINASGASEGFHRGEISSVADVLDIYRVWWNKRHWVQPEVFWRRSLWDRVGPINDSYDLAFDYEYWTRCFIAGARTLRIPRPLAQFRRHDQQKSVAGLKAAAEIRSIVTRALNSGAPLNTEVRQALSNRLSYDLYRSGETGRQDAFWMALLTHPAWLGLPEVRDRLSRSGKSRLFRG